MIYLLYSYTQMAYHSCSLEEMVMENIEQLIKQKGTPDWIVVGIANNQKEANENFYKIKEKLGRP